MESKRLSKHQTRVVQLLGGGAFTGLLGGVLIFVYSLGAFAQSTLPGTSPSTTALAAGANDMAICNGKSGKQEIFGTACADLIARGRGATDPCQTAFNTLGEATSAIGKACGFKSSKSSSIDSTCMDKINACNGDASADDDIDDDDAKNASPCSNVNKSCPEAAAGSHRDYVEDKKSAEDSMNAAQKNVDELTSKAQKDQATLAQQIQQINDKLQQAAQALKDLERSSVNNALAQTNQANSEKAAAIVAARNKLDAINKTIRDLSDQANLAAENVEKAKLQRTTACKTWAEGQYANDLKELKAKFKAEDSVIRNLGSATQMMAYTNQQAKTRLAAQNSSYQGHYLTCMSGTEGNGASGGTAAQQAITEAETSARDAASSRDKQMGQLKLDSDSAAKDLQTKLDEVTTNLALQKKVITDNLQSANEKYTTQATQAAADIKRLTDQANQQQQLTSQQQSTAQQTLMRTQTEFGTASTQLSCDDSVRKGISESRAKTKMENWSKAGDSVRKLSQACSTLTRSCPTYDSSSCPNAPSARSITPPATTTTTSGQ